MNKSDYFETEKNIFELLKKSLGTRLLFYCLTGSLARGKPVPGWSDIDILLVVDVYSPDFFALLESVAMMGEIKVGMTFYSLEEFNERYFRDPKTHAALELIEKGIYIPRIISDEVFAEMVQKFPDFPVVDKSVDSIYYDEWKERSILIFEWIRTNSTKVFPLMKGAKTMIDRVRSVIVKEEKVLLIERVKSGKETYYVFPGGGVERSDSNPEEALKRECREELGLEVQIEQEVCRTEFNGQVPLDTLV